MVLCATGHFLRIQPQPVLTAYHVNVLVADNVVSEEFVSGKRTLKELNITQHLMEVVLPS